MKTRRLTATCLSLLGLGACGLGACDRQVLLGVHGTDGSAGNGSAGGAGAGTGGDTGGRGAGGNAVGACMPLPAIPRRLWRLTSEQYANSLRDLLSLNAAPVIQPSLNDRSSPGYFINGPELDVEPDYLTGSLYKAGRDLLTQIVPRIGDVCSGARCLLTCLAGETHQDCATRFARTFGARAFRRPLDAIEVTNLMKVYGTVCPGPSPTCASSADFTAAISLMIRALILAPSFLYRSELGPQTLVADAAGNYPDTTLTPHEVATQLGYLFLNSTPDDALTAAANSGSLATTAGIASEVSRLLTLPAVTDNLTHVVTNWFGAGQLPNLTSKDPGLLSPLGAADRDQVAITSELATSVAAFVGDVLWTNPARPITDLLTSPKVFLTDRLATLYGLPPAGAGSSTFTAFNWPATEQRAGILTQPALLWAVSDPSLNSIVKRGKFIHDDVVCQDPLPSPTDLSTPAAVAIIALGNSETTKSQARLQAPVCSACHFQIDPYGALLQGFDPIGRHRSVDEVGAPIDLTTTLPTPSPLAPLTISGPPALATALISTRVFEGCSVQQMAGYTIGGRLRSSNICEIKALAAQFGQSNGSMTSLLVQLMLADFVRARTGGAQ